MERDNFVNNQEEDEEINTALSLNRNLNIEQPINVSTKNTFHNRKILIIFIIATFTKAISLICRNLMHIHILNMQCNYVNQIFMPFLLYEAVDLFIIKNSVKENAFLNTLFFFSNIPLKYTQNITCLINILGTILHDMFLYFFIFIVLEICFYVSLGL